MVCIGPQYVVVNIEAIDDAHCGCYVLGAYPDGKDHFGSDDDWDFLPEYDCEDDANVKAGVLDIIDRYYAVDRAAQHEYYYYPEVVIRAIYGDAEIPPAAGGMIRDVLFEGVPAGAKRLFRYYYSHGDYDDEDSQ